MENSKKEIILLFLLLLIPFVIGSLVISSPLFGDINLIDEGQLAAWANHMMHGKLMYRDIYITYGPYYTYPIYLMFKFFGPSVFAIRMYVAIWGAFGIIAFYLLVREFKFKKIVFYPLIVTLAIFPGANIRQACVFFVLWMFVKSFESNLSFFAGLFLAFSFLISPEIAFLLVPVLIFLFVSQFRSKLLKKVVLMSILGCFVGFSFFVAWSIREQWFLDYVSTTVDVLSSFSGKDLPNGKAMPDILKYYTLVAPSLGWMRYAISKDALLYIQFLTYIVAIVYLFFRKITSSFGKKEGLLMCITILGLVNYYSLIGRGGNFFGTFASMLIVFACFIEVFISSYKKKSQKLVIFTILAILFLVIRVYYIFWPSLFLLQKNIGLLKDTNSVSKVGKIVISQEQKEYIDALTRYIAKNTVPTDYIFFLSNEPMLYMLSDRVNPTRYDLPYIAHTIDKRYELMNDIKLRKPKLIFYDTVSWPVDEVSNKERLPEVLRFIEKNYKKTNLLNNRVEVYTLMNEK